MKQFDLEQNIMECWNVTSDIDILIENYDSMSEDSILNILIGMKEMYQLRFDKMFRSFEDLLQEQKKYRDAYKITVTSSENYPHEKAAYDSVWDREPDDMSKTY